RDTQADNGAAVFAFNTSVHLKNCVFSGDTATGRYGGGQGGAIYAQNSTVTVDGCTFSSDVALAIPASSAMFGAVGDAKGGAIYAKGGQLQVSNSTFTGDEARGQVGAGALGGAIDVEDAALTVIASKFASNQASTSVIAPVNVNGSEGVGGAIAF